MASSQYPIVPDGNSYAIIPRFTIRNYEVFNEGQAPLAVYSNLGILIEVVYPGGYSRYNGNYQSLTGKFVIPTTGKGLITVYDTYGPTQPATIPGYAQLNSSNTFIGEVLRWAIIVGSGTTAGSLNFTMQIQNNDTLFLLLYVVNNTGTFVPPSTITDTQQNIYTLIQTGANTGAAGHNNQAFLYCCLQAKPLSTMDSIVDIGASGSNNYGIAVWDFRLLLPQLDIGVGGSNVSTTALSAGPLANAEQAELLFAAFGAFSAGVITPTIPVAPFALASNAEWTIDDMEYAAIYWLPVQASSPTTAKATAPNIVTVSSVFQAIKVVSLANLVPK